MLLPEASFSLQFIKLASLAIFQSYDCSSNVLGFTASCADFFLTTLGIYILAIIF